MIGKFHKISILIVSLSALSACTTAYKPEPKLLSLQKNSSIAVTAGVSQTFVRNKGANYTLCTQSMADAAFDEGSGGDISYALINASKDEISAVSDANEVEMAGRTPAVLMARELLFRACEFSSNFGLNKKEAMDIYNKTLDTIGNVWATEAGNTTVTVGDNIGNASTLSQNESNSDAVSGSSTTIGNNNSDDDDE